MSNDPFRVKQLPEHRIIIGKQAEIYLYTDPDAWLC